MYTYKLFKYRAVNKNLIDSLINRYVYCATPDSLNDPFDCRVSILDSLSRAKNECYGKSKLNLERLIASEKFITSVQKRISEIGICSFSADFLKPVLWTHYADEHRGVCLLYSVPDSQINWEKNRIVGISKVDYGANVLSDAFKNLAENLENMDVPAIMKAISIPLFISKGEDWRYEEEIRVIKDASGPLEIQKPFLTQICFGMRTPERDKKLIRSIIKDCGYSVNYCEITSSKTDFGIVAKDLY